MKTLCLCMLAALMVTGCATKTDVGEMIDMKVNPQVEQLNTQLDAQSVAVVQAVEDMKGFVDRLGKTMDSDMKGLQSDVSKIQMDLKSVKADLAATDGDVSAVSEKVEDLDKSVNSLASQVDMMKSSLDTVQAGVESAISKADAAEKSAARLATGQ